MGFTDTTPDAEEVQIALLREASAWRKLEMAFDLNRTLKRLMIANLDFESPDEIRFAVAERWLGSELAEKAYGVNPSVGGRTLG